MTAKNFNIGHFINECHVVKAFSLLTKQLKEKNFTFKTLDFEIYRNEIDISRFDVSQFYKNFVAKDLLYNYRSIFYNKEYTIPKGTYGVRKFNFTSFHSMLLYYSLGFYFFDIIRESLSRLEPAKEKQKNIQTFYGGAIKFDKPEKSKIYYQTDYADFNEGIKNRVKEGLADKKKVCVIKLDIQDFYASIKTKKLLQVIEKFSLPSARKRLRFDNTTREVIIDLFLFFNKKESGLPLSAQNIISNFISNIFLFELDDFVQKLAIHSDQSFSYFRYVDDFYIIYNKKRTAANEKVGDEIFEISTSISDFLSTQMDLKINHLKSRKWIIEGKEDYKAFITKEKFISFFEPNGDSSRPEEKLELVCDIIEDLKDNYKLTGTTQIEDNQDVTLKEIFISSTRNYVKSKKAKARLDEAFKKWNPILTLNSVKALMFLIGNSREGLRLIKQYLSTDFDVKIQKTQNLYLLESYIKLETYDKSLDRKILKSKNRSLYFSLIKRMIEGAPDLPKKYLPFEDEILSENDSLMQQLKMLVIAEEEGKYNLAFSHLLNCFHFYCFIKDVKKKQKLLKNYDQNSVVNFLTEQKASLEEINFTMSFFDRRNKNSISHSGDDLLENWAVNKEEYQLYYRKMVLLVKRKIK